MKPNLSNHVLWAVCRICLKEADYLQSISIEDEEKITIAEKISICGAVDVNINDKHFPDKVCMKCLEQLNNAYSFRNICQTTDKLLQSIVSSFENERHQTDQEDSSTIQSREIEHIVSDIRGDHSRRINIEIKKELNEFDSNDERILTINKNGSCNQYTVQAMKHNVKNELEEEQPKLVDYQVEIDCRETKNQLYVETDENSKESDEIMKIISSPIASRNGNIPDMNLDSEVITESSTLRKSKKRVDCRELKVTDDNSLKKYVCEVCGNRYVQKSQLESHTKWHSTNKNYKCEVCQKEFTVQFQLNRHMRIHTGEKPYKCTTCGRSFSDYSSCKKHERTHTDERPFKCELCGKGFNYTYVLKKHMTVHTGEKPHTCTICGKKFSQSYHLKTHMASSAHQSFKYTFFIQEDMQFTTKSLEEQPN